MKNNSTIQQFNNSTSNDVAIKVENVSKKFCKSLKKSMFYGIKDITKNALGMSSNSGTLRKDEFWAVEDISFEVKKGETLGIIGANGAGKTTILKMLNGIFWPDKGKITIKGKTGALIAVGAGFHPMLTGRENIYINGAILGMSRKEVNEKFDAIVEFADIGDFLDTPVKFYSSGMFVRLGFSVAVHCAPDILLVDEVLAVGDIDFQSKCFNKIGDLMEEGITTILVTHNLVSIKRICGRCLWINSGTIIEMGDTYKVCDSYQLSNLKECKKSKDKKYKDKGLSIKEAIFKDQHGNKKVTFSPKEKIIMELVVESMESVNNPLLEIKMKTSKGIKISHTIDEIKIDFAPKTKKKINFIIDSLPLTNDVVNVNILLWNTEATELYARRSGVYFFKIISSKHIDGQLDINYYIKPD